MVSIDRALAAVLVGAVVLAFAVVVHQYTHQAGSAPYVAVDDAVGNISVAMHKLGRNGLLASPVQGKGNEAPRNFAQFNYGPAPFAVGAVLDWLFGTSYAVQRAVHPLGLMVAAALAFVVFRRACLAAAGLFALFMAFFFWPVHWPMMRPDMTVAVIALAAVAAATFAVAREAAWPWALVGFLAVTAATSHQIAWTLVPWALCVWAVAAWLVRRDRGALWKRPAARSLCAGLAGGIAAGLIYLAAIDFRIADLFALWRDYARFAAPGESASFADILAAQFREAWVAVSLSPAVALSLFVLAVGGVALAVWALWRRLAVGREVAALTVPPVLAEILYLLSLGAYNNFHHGYALLQHFLVTWSACAALAGAALVLRERSPALSLMSNRLLVGGLAAVVLVFAARGAGQSTYWMKYAATTVPFDDYQTRLFEPIPQGASVFGGVVFGLDSGDRVQLVQVRDGTKALKRVKTASRSTLAPDFLIVNELFKHSAFAAVSDKAAGNSQGSFLEELPALLPDVRYAPVSIVFARPYGEGRVYRRGKASGPPGVAVYDPVTKTWARTLARIPARELRAGAPAQFRINHGGWVSAEADRTRSLFLDPGDYLIALDLTRGPGGIGGVIMASASRKVSAVVGDLALPFSVAPYFPYDSIAYVLLHHAGGRVFLSQFDADARADFSLRSLWRIDLSADPTAAFPAPLPPLGDWRPYSAAVSVEPGPDGGLLVHGNPRPTSGQLISPPLRLPAGTIEVTVPLSVAGGTAAFGILNADRSAWLAPPRLGRGPLRLRLERETPVHVVISSLEVESGVPLEIRVAPGGYRVAPDDARPYVDRLVDCLWPAPRHREICNDGRAGR